jgi:CheY-like chemotaxis protein
MESMKILVVHRQKSTVAVIKSVLSKSHPVVLQTESGLDGLLTSRIEHFDLIICGTDLPVVTGFEVIRSVRTNSVNRFTPVIFVCEELSAKTEHLGRALGAEAIIAESTISEVLPGIINDLNGSTIAFGRKSATG